ncbi:MAG: response regulator transcription factor [Gammaproteobacteria bacterium]|nr:response regulator transcription factor [Gammaproteobacteria bacterium]MCP5201900.1 response regulator transcription factor [Gammaproteobacteria bacterium]
MLKILIADDHALIRGGLQQLLGRLDGEVCCLEADSAEAALAVARAEPALDLVLLDLGLPDCADLDLLCRFVRDFPLLPVLIVSASAQPALMRTALDQGAMGFIPKSAAPEILLHAVRLVLAGEIYVPAQVLQAPRDDRSSAAAGLTARQLEVLAHLAAGATNKDIARELALAEATVKVHVTAILKHLEARNRTEAARRARELGLLDDRPGA